MAVSPFTFLRGSAAVMTADLAAMPTTGLQVQACGDCHLMNFGLFATPERNVVFGLNDFDETMPGPWEWDLKRLTASFVVACRDVRLTDAQAEGVAAAAVRSYRERLAEFAEMSPLEIWYDRIDLAKATEMAPDKAARKRREQLDQQARKRVAENLFPKLVTTEGGRRRIADQPPLIFHPPDLTKELALEFIETYRASLADDRRLLFDRYTFEDAAAKVVGVGSVGTRCFVALFTSDDRPSTSAADQGSQPVGAGAVRQPQQEEDPQRRPGRRRSAPHAAGQRHLPRVGHRAERSRLLHPPTPRHEGLGDPHCRHRAPSPATPSSAAWRWPAPTPTPAPPARSRATSAPDPSPTRPSPSSEWPTPTRPFGTTGPSSRQ